MASEEVVVGDGDIRGRSRCASGADGDVVIPIGDPRPGNGNIGRISRIDAVGIARGCRRYDLDVPGGKITDRAACRNVEEGCVAQRDLIQRDVAGAGFHLDPARILLAVRAGVGCRQSYPGQGMRLHRET